MPKRRYITTAIDYPNAAPHMGHVLEKVLADVFARWCRLQGDEVRLQIGTDEHGIKIQQTAEKEGMTPRALVDRNVPVFQSLYQTLGISADVFLRTSDQKIHWPTVQELWKRLKAQKMLEQRTYVGLYCSGCERFVTKKDLVDGLCPTHQRAPEEVKEENWFFLLSREQEWLQGLLGNNGKYSIIPLHRAQETLSILEQGLEDVSFSRPKTTLSWGIPVPDDENQTMYVWCDALTNYISGLGFFTNHEERQWWDEAEVTHVIGKDIARFHALIWPAMLKHAVVKKMPDRLLMHGFLTSEGQKMSKSLGNVVVPQDVIAKYGIDPLRFYLSAEIPVGNDGDFSWERFGKLYDSVLRGTLGNLLNRVLVLLSKDGGALETAAFQDPSASELKNFLADTWKKYTEHMEVFEFSQAIGLAIDAARRGNVIIDQQKPWSQPKEIQRVQLTCLAELLRHTALLLLPFLPQSSVSMLTQLGCPSAALAQEKTFSIPAAMKEFGGEKNWKNIGEPKILFAPLEKPKS